MYHRCFINTHFVLTRVHGGGQVPDCFSCPLSSRPHCGSWLRGAHTPRAAEEAPGQQSLSLQGTSSRPLAVFPAGPPLFADVG